MYNEEEFKENLKKGWEFQQYIENNFFPKPIYSIGHRTSHFEESKTLDDNRPDYTFIANYNSGKKFHVECKYRSKYFHNIELLREKEIELFKELKNKGEDIFVILGIGGEPSNPSRIFVFPFNDEVFKFSKFRLYYVMGFEREGRNYFIYDNGQLY